MNTFSEIHDHNKGTPICDDLLHSGLANIKFEGTLILNEFRKNNAQEMESRNCYFYYTILVSDINVEKRNITKHVSTLLSYDMFNMKEIKNLIKKCPHCGEVWYKLFGCSDVYCGVHPDHKDKLSSSDVARPYTPYKFEYKDNKYVQVGEGTINHKSIEEEITPDYQFQRDSSSKNKIEVKKTETKEGKEKKKNIDNKR